MTCESSRELLFRTADFYSDLTALLNFIKMAWERVPVICSLLMTILGCCSWLFSDRSELKMIYSISSVSLCMSLIFDRLFCTSFFAVLKTFEIELIFL